MKFLRREVHNYSRLGRRRKKLQKWRRPTGRDNPMREKKRGKRNIVSIGYKNEKRISQKVIYNIKDLEHIKENEKVILGNVGKKKKIELLRKIKEKGIEIEKINVEKFLKRAENKKNGGVKK